MLQMSDADQYLSVDLQRLDVLLHREIIRLRARYQLSLDEFRGLYISDEQVNHLIDQTLGYNGSASVAEELTRRAEALHTCNTGQRREDQPWTRLAATFGLSPLEQDILLLALAPEIDLKYETLYAYLNNDVTRKYPTFDLALRLLSNSLPARMTVRRVLMPEQTLFTSGLLQQIQPAPQRPLWLARGFSISPPALSYLLGGAACDPTQTAFIECRRPALEWQQIPVSGHQRAALKRLLNLFTAPDPERPAPVVIFAGRQGSGRNLAAEAICRELGLALLNVDVEAASVAAEPWPKLIAAVRLQQQLQRAGIYLARGDAWF